MSEHGTHARYTNGGCRCTACKDAQADDQARGNADRRRRLADGTGSPVHGRASTYDNWGCRCADCSAAHQHKMKADREDRKRRIADGTARVMHGKVSTYTSWGCRCEPCKQASALARAVYPRNRTERQK